MHLKGCSQHDNGHVILAFPIFLITVHIEEEIAFGSHLPSPEELVHFDEQELIDTSQPKTASIQVSNCWKNYTVPVESTIQKITHKYMPSRATQHSADSDIFAISDTSISPNSRKAIPTGLSMAIPPGLYGRIAPQSDLALKHNIDKGVGVIDSEYQGELMKFENLYRITMEQGHIPEKIYDFLGFPKDEINGKAYERKYRFEAE
eukprot:15336264-Ditylum_brightwellii.AAC.1